MEFIFRRPTSDPFGFRWISNLQFKFLLYIRRALFCCCCCLMCFMPPLECSQCNATMVYKTFTFFSVWKCLCLLLTDTNNPHRTTEWQNVYCILQYVCHKRLLTVWSCLFPYFTYFCFEYKENVVSLLYSLVVVHRFDGPID